MHMIEICRNSIQHKKCFSLIFILAGTASGRETSWNFQFHYRVCLFSLCVTKTHKCAIFYISISLLLSFSPRSNVIEVWYSWFEMVKMRPHGTAHGDYSNHENNGLFKKKCQKNCSSAFCWSLLLFYSDMMHKQRLKVWFLTSQMPILSGRINFVPFSTTWNFGFPKIPMKYSRNGQKYAMSKNASIMLLKTCWTLCKKRHLSTWSRSRYTFFLDDPLLM